MYEGSECRYRCLQLRKKSIPNFCKKMASRTWLLHHRHRRARVSPQSDQEMLSLSSRNVVLSHPLSCLQNWIALVLLGFCVSVRPHTDCRYEGMRKGKQQRSPRRPGGFLMGVWQLRRKRKGRNLGNAIWNAMRLGECKIPNSLLTERAFVLISPYPNPIPRSNPHNPRSFPAVLSFVISHCPLEIFFNFAGNINYYLDPLYRNAFLRSSKFLVAGIFPQMYKGSECRYRCLFNFRKKTPRFLLKHGVSLALGCFITI